MKIIRFIHKMYSLLFYKLVKGILRLDEVCSKDFDFSMEWVMYRAFFAIYAILGFWYFTFWTIVEIITRKSIPNLIDNSTISPIFYAAVFFIFNYFTLIYKKRWFQYDEEFAAYSKTKNKVINIGIFIFYVLSIVLYFVLMDVWADLGHAGKIEGFGTK